MGVRVERVEVDRIIMIIFCEVYLKREEKDGIVNENGFSSKEGFFLRIGVM